MLFAGSYSFGDSGNGYSYFGTIVLGLGFFIYVLSYGILLGRHRWKLVIAIIIPIVGMVNGTIMMALTIDGRDGD
jgi:hypothetical protein